MKKNLSGLMLSVFFSIFFSGFFVLFIFAGASFASSKESPDLKKILSSMTLRQKVGQLFVIRPEQLDPTLSPEKAHKERVPAGMALLDIMRQTMKDCPPGGFALFGKNIRTPEHLREFTRELKEACEKFSGAVPVMAIDEEGGQISRIANSPGFNVVKFKSMETLGNTRSPQKVREAASAIAAYIKDYGFTMDFAPVADVNTNPENIVIGNRSFGRDPALVSRMVSAYLDGLHSQGIAGSIKHFPGHGDTKGDTHSGYVAVNKTWGELLKAELIPFRENFKKADSVMTAHITLRNITDDGLPATLSRELITGKLRGELGYNGVVITDALKMGAIVDAYTSEEAALLAFEAGNDILLLPWDYREAFNGILRAVQSGRIPEARLNESVLRILNLKYKK